MNWKPLNITVRVGCRIAYETTVPTPIHFVVRPRLDERHLVGVEKFSFGPGHPSGQFQDSHGNIICRSMLQPGRNELFYDAMVAVSSEREDSGTFEPSVPVPELPSDILRYTLPSRYCDSDKLMDFAWKHFGHINSGHERLQAICDWVHNNIEYRYGSGSPHLSASDILERRYGICRDFAHTGIALCRAFNMPARYVSGHLPEIGHIDSGTGGDFHAYGEVYLGQNWYIFDPRFNYPRIGRIKLSHGLDAVDGAFATIYGEAKLVYFEVWAYQVNPHEVSIGDPIDLSKRLDSSLDVRLK